MWEFYSHKVLLLNLNIVFNFLQNLLTSEQSCIILKSITKLPIELAPIYYPTLLTIIWENVEAEEKLSKDFDVQVSVWERIVLKSLESKMFFWLYLDVEGVRKVTDSKKESIASYTWNLRKTRIHCDHGAPRGAIHHHFAFYAKLHR